MRSVQAVVSAIELASATHSYNVFNCGARALRAYDAMSDDELSFHQGQVTQRGLDWEPEIGRPRCVVIGVGRS